MTWGACLCQGESRNPPFLISTYPKKVLEGDNLCPESRMVDAKTIEIGYIEGERVIKINFGSMYRFTNS